MLKIFNGMVNLIISPAIAVTPREDFLNMHHYKFLLNNLSFFLCVKNI